MRALVPIALLFALLAVGCGGSGAETQSSAQETTSAPQATTASPKERPAQKPHTPSTQPQKEEKPTSLAKAKAAYHQRILTQLGEDASVEETQAVSSAILTYTEAVATRDWSTACGALAKGALEQLNALVAKGKQLPCEKLLASVLRDPTALGEIEITEVRVGGEGAYAVYRQSGVEVAIFPATREGGVWKAGAVEGSVLP